MPSSLGIELSIEHNLASEATLLHDANVLAVGRSHQTTEDHPAPPPWGEAVLASEAYVAMTDNDYPNCFGCGPALPDGKGIRVFTGPIKGRDLVAAAGRLRVPLRRPTVCSCLSTCGQRSTVLEVGPGGSSSRGACRHGVPERSAKTPILAGAPYLVTGWPVRQDGRKSFVGMAIFDRDGVVCAVGEGALDHRSPDQNRRSGHPTLAAGRDTPCSLVITGKPLTHRSGRSCCRERPR